jgi:hypothetical protein
MESRREMRGLVYLLTLLVSSFSFASLRLGGDTGTGFYSLSKNESRGFLSKSDTFSSKMTVLDRILRSRDPSITTEIAFLEYASIHTLDWTDGETALLKNMVAAYAEVTRRFNIPRPKEIFIIKTDGSEEFGAAYTRGNAVVLPAKLFRFQPTEVFKTFTHEIYHILTRGNPDFRSQMNAIIGFRESSQIEKLPSRNWQSLTNPDYYENSYYLPVNIRGKKRNVVPVLVSPFPSQEILRARNPLEAFESKLLLLANDFSFLRNQGGNPIFVDHDKTDFNDKVGFNTSHTMHPEEIMADNFAILLGSLRDQNSLDRLPSPGILDALLSSPYFLNQRVTTYQARFEGKVGLSHDDFMDVIKSIENMYQPLARHELGRPLLFEMNWGSSSETANASSCAALYKKSEYFLQLDGGLARNPMMTKDTYAGIVCHELGHCLGGSPVAANNNQVRHVSVELQADYWSTAKCLRKYFEKEGGKNLRWAQSRTIEPIVREKCNAVFGDPLSAAICMREGTAAIEMVRIMEKDLPPAKKDPPARIETPSIKTVSKTERYYADMQCRLDTLFQGALCEKNADIQAKYGDEYLGFCNRVEGYTLGIRPSCWYVPGGPVHRKGDTSY